MEIRGRVALLTGAARRIGRATALELGRRGARVVVHYRSSEEAARRTVREIEAFGVEAAALQADLAETDAPARVVEGTLSRFGALDILINNASVFGRAGLDESTCDLWDEQMDTNARAPFFLAQASSRAMRDRGSGKIVNMADPAGELIWTSYLAYSISKAALLAGTRGLARALAPDIQVNAVAPGPVEFPEDYTDDQKRLAIERTLLKRAGSPADVVRAIVFLIGNDYITGEVIHVDGGRHAL